MVKFSTVLLCILFLYAGVLFSQEKEISGIVFSKTDNAPLPGATVLIKGTKAGAITDFDGKFKYLVRTPNITNTVLVISFLGFKDKEITLGNQAYFEVYLEEDVSSLDEVVVTSSYGTKKQKEEVVASIVSINSEKIQATQALESVDKMLDGLAAGVLITGNTTIGGPVRIDIRGQGSLTPLTGNLVGSSTQPLIIIDGVILTEEAGFDNELFDGTGTLAENFANPLARISPEDIENVTVLKDAAAVGLYGSDAANGVILITTKKGRASKPSFNFTAQSGVSSPMNQIKYLNGPQYHDIYSEYLISQGNSPEQAAALAGARNVNTDWFGLVNSAGFFSRYGFNANWAKSGFDYRFSLNYLNNQEPQIENNFKRYGASFNIGYAQKAFQLRVSLVPSFTLKNEPNRLFNFALPPNIQPFNSDGSFALLGFEGFGNPLAVAKQNLNETKTMGVLGSINASYEITRTLKVSALYGLDYADKNQDRYFSGANESGRFNGTFEIDGVTYPNWGRRLIFDRNSTRWNFSAQALYNEDFKSHHLDGLLGVELQSEIVEGVRKSGTGFIEPFKINDYRLAGNSSSDTTATSEQKRRSVFTQINYDYKKKYFFLLNVRRDESSAFGGDKNVAYNGGAGASWVLSKESFLQSMGWLDFLRFRISYGVTGNSRIGPYRALGLYNVSFNGGYNDGDYAIPATLPNPFLGWERNYKFNTGIDFNFLNRYRLTAEYFYDDRRDLITSVDVPAEVGLTTLQINGASMYNKGVELSFEADWFKTKSFSWRTNLTFSKITNKVTETFGLGTDFSSAERARALRVGSPTSAIWGVRWAGVDPATGRELFSLNGQLYDGATYNRLFDETSREIIGNSQPDFFGGIFNTFTYKGLSLSVRATYRYGEDFLIQDELENQYRVLVNRNLSVNVLDRWQQPGDVAPNPAVVSTNPILSNSSKYLFDGSHVKIQNISLNYSIPLRSVTKGLFIENLSLFADVSNVVYFYREKSPKDRNGAAEYRFLYPEARTITLGVNASF